MTPARDRIAAATLTLIEEQGFGAVTIAAAARAAGVTRQTVYTAFGSREALVSQVVAGVALEALAGLRATLDPAGGAAEYLAGLIVGGRRAVRDRPVLAALLRPGEGNPLFDAGAIDRARPVVVELLAPLYAHRPDLRGTDDGDPVAEYVARIGLSVVLFDSEPTRADDDLRRLLVTWFRAVVADPD